MPPPPRPTRSDFPACSSLEAERRDWQEASDEDRDLLVPRARERVHRLPADHRFHARGARPQVAALRRRSSRLRSRSTCTASSRRSRWRRSESTGSRSSPTHTIEITFGDLVIPFTAPYKPLWTGLGVIAADLALIVAISFPLKKRIGGRNWRRLHWATYSIFALSTAHGLAAGTDSAQPWAMQRLPGRGRRSRVRHGVACVRRPSSSRTSTSTHQHREGATHVQDPDRPVAV